MGRGQRLLEPLALGGLAVLSNGQCQEIKAKAGVRRGDAHTYVWVGVQKPFVWCVL